MGVYKYIILGVLIFIIGWLSADLYSFVTNLNIEKPFSFSDNELKSPSDWVKEDQIKIYQNRVLINIENASWARFSDTNSMDPLIDEESNSIEIKPRSNEDLKVGDIISYEAKFTKGTLIHRIVKIDYDEDGWYALTKGDNNKNIDPQKVRFEQIKGVLIGIIY